MSGPSLQRLAVLSTVFHLTFFLAVFFAAKHSGRFVMPSPYVVNLVGSEEKPEGKTEGRADTRAVSKAPEPETPTVSRREETVSPSSKEANKLRKKEERQLRDRIADLRNKKNSIDKLRKLAELRKELDAIKKGGREGKATHSYGVSGKGGSPATSDYSAKILSEIKQYYEITPDLAGKNLAATVSIKMAKDGFVQACRIKESSGNLLFDRSVVKAINKASPLTPPPDEEKMDIEVRFLQ